MQLALLQPQFAPNLYDLSSVIRTDKLIWLDSTRWSRKGRSHRALIRTQEHTQWINIPVVTEDRKKFVRDVRIDHNQNWFTPFWNALEYNYRNSIYFDYYEPEIRHDLEQALETELLCDFNRYMFNRLCIYLEIDVQTEIQSKVPFLTGVLEKGEYYIEHDSKNYLQQGLALPHPLQDHPIYTQHFGGFVEGCSILDLLFECGPEGFRVLDKLV